MRNCKIMCNLKAVDRTTNSFYLFKVIASFGNCSWIFLLRCHITGPHLATELLPSQMIGIKSDSGRQSSGFYSACNCCLPAADETGFRRLRHLLSEQAQDYYISTLSRLFSFITFTYFYSKPRAVLTAVLTLLFTIKVLIHFTWIK